jgi:nitroimidazol reductase NimA-like FMN-containing flavoprotein (pyridoxamine 5'-phosphate oxidase superfamily)
MYHNRTPRSQIRRHPDRASYERGAIEAILDDAFVCHVGLVADGAAVVIPMVYGRVGDTLYLHGSRASRLLKELPRGARVCVTVTLVDGLVLARSAPKHSVNYRSVVVFGAVTVIDDPALKLVALNAIVDHALPGRSHEARAPTDGELSAVSVVALAIEDAAAKTRAGPPVDDEADRSLPIWAGEVPLSMTAGAPSAQAAEVPLPRSVRSLLASSPEVPAARA